MRPTGQLHLGHYTGALESWVQQQNLLDDKGAHVFETCFLIADYHNLTTSLETGEIYANTLDMLVDWLAAGVDPEKSPVFASRKSKNMPSSFCSSPCSSPHRGLKETLRSKSRSAI